MKKLVYIVCATWICTAAALVSTELYTESKTQDLAKRIVSGTYYSFGSFNHVQSNPDPVSLGSVLYDNIYAQSPGEKMGIAGDYTTDSYKNGFRKLIAKNPQLAYTTWDTYGDQFIKNINTELKALKKKKVDEMKKFKYGTDTSSRLTHYVYKKDENGKSKRYYYKEKIRVYTYKIYTKGPVEKSYEKKGNDSYYYYPLGPVKDSLKKFDVDVFWNQQKELIKHYNILIDELVKLDEKTLNSYMYEIRAKFNFDQSRMDKEKTEEFRKWLVNKKLLAPLPEGKKYYPYGGDAVKDGAWNFYEYPVDLLFLAVRVKDDYPEWEYKKFFKEVKKFSNYVAKDLP